MPCYFRLNEKMESRSETRSNCLELTPSNKHGFGLRSARLALGFNRAVVPLECEAIRPSELEESFDFGDYPPGESRSPFRLLG